MRVSGSDGVEHIVGSRRCHEDGRSQSAFTALCPRDVCARVVYNKQCFPCLQPHSVVIFLYYAKLAPQEHTRFREASARSNYPCVRIPTYGTIFLKDTGIETTEADIKGTPRAGEI